MTLPLAASWLKDVCGLPRERRRTNRRAAAAAAAAPVAPLAAVSTAAAPAPVASAPGPLPNGVGAEAPVPPRNGAIEWDIALSEWRSGFERKPVATGLKGVDELLGGGFRDRRLYVARRARRRGKERRWRSGSRMRPRRRASPVIYLSYEMEEIEARARLVAAAMKTPFGQLLAPDALLQVEREQVGIAWRKYAESGPGTRILLSGLRGGRRRRRRAADGDDGVAEGRDRPRARDFGQPPLVVVDDLQAAAAFSEEFEGDPSELLLRRRADERSRFA